MTGPMEESVRFVCTPADRLVLDLVAEADVHDAGGRPSISATLRRMIREEGKRRGVVIDMEMTEAQAS